jgi:hypothetical protein
MQGVQFTFAISFLQAGLDRVAHSECHRSHAMMTIVFAPKSLVPG